MRRAQSPTAAVRCSAVRRQGVQRREPVGDLSAAGVAPGLRSERYGFHRLSSRATARSATPCARCFSTKPRRHAGSAGRRPSQTAESGHPLHTCAAGGNETASGPVASGKLRRSDPQCPPPGRTRRSACSVSRILFSFHRVQRRERRSGIAMRDAIGDGAGNRAALCVAIGDAMVSAVSVVTGVTVTSCHDCHRRSGVDGMLTSAKDR